MRPCLWLRIHRQKNLDDLGPPQTRRLVVDNYFLSTTVCRRQPKNIVCGANCRQLNAKNLSCRRFAVSLVKKGSSVGAIRLVVDNYHTMSMRREN